MLLWSTNATGAEVVAASEKRFSLTATLKLQLPRAHTAVASLVMARDSWKEPFSWRISAGEKSSNDEVWRGGGLWGQAQGVKTCRKVGRYVSYLKRVGL